MQSQRLLATEYFESLQSGICSALETVDGKERFSEDSWKHDSGGGGRTRIIQNGLVWEKGGVSTSAIQDMLTETLAEKLGVSPQAVFATGVSLVLHPLNPMIPTVHANFRYLELENGDFWFGGGADLTPYYLFRDDVVHFHRTWKDSCDKHNPAFYPRFKSSCDEYFFLQHRKEARGVGGIFFDYLRGDFKSLFQFVKSCGDSFLPAYLPIAERRKNEPWGDTEREWQLVRRGRYVEFNLVYDRGTLFGMETRGRIESVLMSLPPLVRWTYDHHPDEGSREEELLLTLQSPQTWIS